MSIWAKCPTTLRALKLLCSSGWKSPGSRLPPCSRFNLPILGATMTTVSSKGKLVKNTSRWNLVFTIELINWLNKYVLTKFYDYEPTQYCWKLQVNQIWFLLGWIRWFEVTHYFFMTDFKKIPAWWRIKFTERFLSVQVSMKMVEKLGRRAKTREKST